MCLGLRGKGRRHISWGPDELLGMVSRAACGLQDEGKVDVRVSIKLHLLGSLGHVSRSVTGCDNEAWAGRQRGSIYVVTPFGSNTRSMRACSTGLFTTRVRAGVACSMLTLVALCV